MRKHEKHKAIAIPVSFLDGKSTKFLTVRDRRFREWTFVTGGCRKGEIVNPLRCALRELEEETRGTVNIKRGRYSYFNFVYKPKPSGGQKMPEDLTYHVYILEYNVPKTEQVKLIDKFNVARGKLERLKQLNIPIKMVYDENDVMDFESLSDFESKGENVWELIRENVLENPKFHNALKSSNMQFFNMTHY